MYVSGLMVNGTSRTIFFLFREKNILLYEKLLILKEENKMLFEKKFEVIEIRKNGVRITHYFYGKKKQVNKDIEMMKNNSKDYQMVGKNAMIVWA